MIVASMPMMGFAEQAPLRGSVIRSGSQQQNPSINPDDIKAIKSGTDLEMTVATALSTSASVQGDEFFAKITKDYTVDGQVVIPRGTLCHGIIEARKGPRRAGRKAYITTRFDYLITPDGREIPIEGKFSNKDKPLKAAAKVVGRGVGYTAAGGVVGAIMVVKYGGLTAVAASNGYALAGGAALGGGVGLASAMIRKGKHQLIQPGAELKIRLKESLNLPTMNMPDESANNYAPEGLKVKILAAQRRKDPFGEPTELMLSLDMTNRTEHTFSFFDIALEDENGTRFYASPFGDTDMWFHKLKPNSKMVGNLSFNVDNPQLEHHLVFFKQYTREPLARIALTSKTMQTDRKTAKKRLQQAAKEHYTVNR